MDSLKILVKTWSAIAIFGVGFTLPLFKKIHPDVNTLRMRLIRVQPNSLIFYRFILDDVAYGCLNTDGVAVVKR